MLFWEVNLFPLCRLPQPNYFAIGLFCKHKPKLKDIVMSDTILRYVEVDDWIFELKSVRAIRVDSYGEPYNAIANLCINGDSVYIDGLMTKDDKKLNQEDYSTFMKLCQRLGLSQIKFEGEPNLSIENLSIEQCVMQSA